MDRAAPGKKQLWTVPAACAQRKSIPMNTTPFAIPDVILLEPKVFVYDRGLFFESFNQDKFEAAIARHMTFVQDNHSRLVKSVSRGLQYQIQQRQGKLVRVVQGEVFDVAVDIHKFLPTVGQWVGEILSTENKRQRRS
jgi:dTDP-4-dehydrorhamnose 3,5-epimerase